MAVDLRHHIARHHVPAAARVFGIGPVVHEADDGADAARDLHQVLDGFDQIVRGADGGGSTLAAGGLLHGVLGRGERLQARPLQGAHIIFIVPAHQSGAGFAPRLFAAFGDVPGQQHAPVGAAHGGAVLLGRVLGKTPLRRQRHQALRRHRAERNDADAVFAGQRHARGRNLRRHHERHLFLQGQDLQRRIVHGEPVALGRDAFAPKQPADDRDRLVLAVALGHRIDAERMRVGSQRSGAGAEDGAAARHMVELHHALGDIVGVVIGQRDHAGAEADALGAFAGGGQEHFRRGDRLPARRVMLAAPEFVVAERVELLDQIEIPAELQHRMLADGMMRGEEGSEFEARHGCSLRNGCCCLSCPQATC